MKSSTFLGSAAGVLLLFSVISYSRTYIQQQDPKPIQPMQPSSSQANPALTADAATPAKETTVSTSTESDSVPATAATAPSEDKTAIETIAVPAQSYTATAYSLRGRTASGKPVARGLIAADPAVLPLGTRVRIEAGSLSGEYLVADTGGAVKGRKIDIWTPTAREALQFGRRAIKLTVLEFGGKRAKNALVRPRLVNHITPIASDNQPSTKPEK
jgi:3D (Asp-Asp-Asp) domain-containing protein